MKRRHKIYNPRTGFADDEFLFKWHRDLVFWYRNRLAPAVRRRWHQLRRRIRNEFR